NIILGRGTNIVLKPSDNIILNTKIEETNKPTALHNGAKIPNAFSRIPCCFVASFPTIQPKLFPHRYQRVEFLTFGVGDKYAQASSNSLNIGKVKVSSFVKGNCCSGRNSYAYGKNFILENIKEG
ncbi:hypothetical protein LINPERPRIM_LOCUS9424, partial [Linum perenne]